MYKDLENEKYDYIIFGTSLTESAISAYLAKSKYRLLQIDISKTYGGDCKNYNLRDMEKLVDEIKKNEIKDSCLRNISIIDHEVNKDCEPLIEKEHYREYNFDLNPKVIYAKSKSCSELIDSKASNYIEFNSVKNIFFMYNEKFLNVPFSKSEIFISNDLDLMEKQKLLNFIFSVMKLKNENVDVNSTVDIKKDIELDDDILYNEIKKNLNEKANDFLNKNFNEKIKNMILFILANQSLISTNMTVDEMCNKIYKFLISLQIYDNTPFLIPQYGSSEFTQAMSRLSAVNGSIFLVNESLSCNINYNKDYKKDDKDSKKYSIEICDSEKNEKFIIYTNNIIINNSYLDDNKSQIKFGDEILIKNTSTDFVYKFTCFYIIKAIGELYTNKEGPVFYRIPPNNSLINNEYAFDVMKYFNNTNNVAKNRLLLQITIVSNINEKDENLFIEKCKKICENFVNKIIEDTEKDIMKNYNNPEFKSKCKFYNMKIKEEKDKEEQNNEKDKNLENNKTEEKKEETKEEKKEAKTEEKSEEKKEEVKAEEKKEGEVKTEEKKEEEVKTEEKKEEVKTEEKKEENKEEKKEEKKEENKEDNKEEKKKEETSVSGAIYIPPKKERPPPKIEEISLKPEKIITYQLNQKILLSDYKCQNEDDQNIIFTKNDFISIDLDDYFEQSFKILKNVNIIKEEEKKEDEKKEEKENEEDEDSTDNNLIDELFGQIELENQEEEKKGEEKKEEEKKEDGKKEEEKKEEEKKENEKKEEKAEKEDNKEENKK